MLCFAGLLLTFGLALAFDLPAEFLAGYLGRICDVCLLILVP